MPIFFKKRTLLKEFDSILRHNGIGNGSYSLGRVNESVVSIIPLHNSWLVYVPVIGDESKCVSFTDHRAAFFYMADTICPDNSEKESLFNELSTHFPSEEGLSVLDIMENYTKRNSHPHFIRATAELLNELSFKAMYLLLLATFGIGPIKVFCFLSDNSLFHRAFAFFSNYFSGYVIIFIVSFTVYCATGFREYRIRKFLKNNLRRFFDEFEDDLRQIDTDNYSLEETLAIITRYTDICKEFPNIVPEYYLRKELPFIQMALEKYKSYYSFMLITHAIDDELISEYPDIYKEQTQPFIRMVQSKLQVIDDGLWKMLLSNFKAAHAQEIEQLHYNMSRLYPIAKERKQKQLENNFEKWFSEQAICDSACVND